ncbi:tRNA (adenosine(37)-N6)-dimethylallyltransferase MiaA [Geomonas sp. Red69]|uniref:tRNA (adenosine(37)-N6)-dimethylallyltransferase MiaA n=1 Tax=Geomonas diazotrophica TaxID=2843197 RepID=UPI001C1063B9|nr:tRNA (adenosine(37)-N6)-dimethylallyltransferase MiaA [Geomonas diazotrophica]MBU5638211.1 tRNA (adenosine(37)-N6)-dimethylallyltransferase MiaA [Geomonas diazotrophica]
MTGTGGSEAPGTPNLLVILGATASGKTRLGVQLAGRLEGEIISADSRQVYRGMDIGTGKDLHEYQGVPYHLIDVAPPGHEFNLFQFQRLFLDAFSDISLRDRLPVLVGGSGMYLDCVLRGYRLIEVPENPALRQELAPLSMPELADRLARANPRLHNSTDLTERSRLLRAIEIAEYQGGGEEPWPEITPCTIGIRWDRAQLRERITKRLRERLEAGMIEEVQRLHAAGTGWDKFEFYGLEYRYVARYLKGELSSNDMFQKLNSAIHDFAKKQENWFKRMQSHGTVIHWVEGAGDPLAESLELLNSKGISFKQG